MQKQIEKLRKLTEDSLATSNVLVAHEKLEEMLVIIEELERARKKQTLKHRAAVFVC